MKKLAIIVAVTGLIGTSALAADMAVKAPPPPPAPVCIWCGFYAGIQGGGGWSDHEAPTLSPNDPIAAELMNGGIKGFAPFVSAPQVHQSGAVGGVEAGYNWQVGSNWLVGFETDFSASGVRGSNSTNGFFAFPFGGPSGPPATQSLTAQVDTDWFGTVRGRAGWLATPNLLLFGTGGFAYGRVSDSVNWAVGVPADHSFAFTAGEQGPSGTFGLACGSKGGYAPCFVGNSGDIRTGWTAGGGAEWQFSQHWSAKIEYQYVDLGTATVRPVASTCIPGFVCIIAPNLRPASFNASFRDQINVVRVGLNYKFDWGAPLVARY